MKRPIATAISLALLAAAPAGAQSIEIMPDGSRPSRKGWHRTSWGWSSAMPQFPAADYSPVSGGQVTLNPALALAGTPIWPAQTLIVTAGTGWVEERGG